MEIIRFSLGQLQANCYFLIDKDNNCLIIDPADDASFILEELQRRRLKLVGMLATHGHFDHVMAAGEIQQSFDLPLFINNNDKFLIERLSETSEYFLGYKPTILPIKKISDFNKAGLDNHWGIKVILTPGHTPGSVSFYLPNEKIVFTGDTLFNGSIGRFDFSYCNKADLKNSILRLMDLPANTKVYCGHGEETLIKDEKNNLPVFFQYLN